MRTVTLCWKIILNKIMYTLLIDGVQCCWSHLPISPHQGTGENPSANITKWIVCISSARAPLSSSKSAVDPFLNSPPQLRFRLFCAGRWLLISGALNYRKMPRSLFVLVESSSYKQSWSIVFLRGLAVCTLLCRMWLDDLVIWEYMSHIVAYCAQGEISVQGTSNTSSLMGETLLVRGLI